MSLSKLITRSSKYMVAALLAVACTSPIYVQAQEIPDSVDHAVPPWHEQDKAEAPDWYKGSFQLGGVWLTNPPAWYVPADVEDGVGNLFVMIDRTSLTNDLTMELTLLDKAGSSLFMDLMSSNFVSVLPEEVQTQGLFGNLIEGSNAVACIQLPISLSEYDDAAVIRLWRGAGEILVYEAPLYIGTLASEEPQEPGIGTATGGQDASGVAGDGLVDDSGSKAEQNSSDQSSRGSAKGRVLHVDAKHGRDSCTGFARTRNGDSGPKKTITAALAVSKRGDTLHIHQGTYTENVSFCGKGLNTYFHGNVSVKKPN